MRKRDAYPYNADSSATRFEFQSVGPRGIIKKVVEFDQMGHGFWNLGFGDWQGSDWTDDIVTNNQDMRDVLQTVANVTHIFFEAHPQSMVVVDPLDRRRKLLYNRIFRERWEEINEIFWVEGVFYLPNGSAKEHFNPRKLYDAFTLRLKEFTFEH